MYDKMSEMQKENSKEISILSKLLIQCRTLGVRIKGWLATYIFPKNPKLETEYGRRDIRGSIEAFVKRFWDADNVPRKVVKVLRKPTREEENEAIQRKQEEARSRAIRIARISRTGGWGDIKKMLDRIEVSAYMKLRHPEMKDDRISLDYFLGFQNGSLSVIEDIRRTITEAVTSLQKKKENAVSKDKEAL